MFSVIRRPQVNYASFTLEVKDRLSNSVVSPKTIELGIPRGSLRRLLAKEQRHNRRLLKGWGRSGGSYSSYRRRRAGFYISSTATHRRRRYYYSSYVSGEPAYYTGKRWTNTIPIMVGATYGMTLGRLNNLYYGGYSPRVYGYTGTSRQYAYPTPSSNTGTILVYNQSFSQSTCPTSSVQSCTCGSTCGTTRSSCTCQGTAPKAWDSSNVLRRSGASGSMTRDYLMSTGFVPNFNPNGGALEFPLTVTIRNLVYQKSITGSQTFTTSTTPSQDLYIGYAEVDSGIRSENNAASQGASISVMAGLAATGAAYFGHQ